MCGQDGPCWPTTPHGPNSESFCNRDLFPLPRLQQDALLSRPNSRKNQQRAGRGRHFTEEVNRTVDSLNSMFDARPLGSDRQTMKPSQGQLQCLEFIQEAVEQNGAPSDLSGPEALEELRVSQGYEELPTTCPLASYNPALVALPSEKMRPVPLDSLWGPDGQQEVEKFYQQRMLDPDEAKVKLEESGVKRCYQDPKLNDPKCYAAFVQRLVRLNLVELSLEAPEESVGLFFVKKKNGQIRLIMDCRRSNCFFCEPDTTHLATGEAMSRMQIDSGSKLYTASADLRNAFYTTAMPEQLRPFFGLRSVRADLLGVTEMQGRVLLPSSRVYPRVCVIPMGWKWALWWCQKVNEKICERSGLAGELRLQDGRPAPQSDMCHVQHVDNLHVFGTCKQTVEKALWGAVSGLRSAGLTVHEIEFDEGESKVLGWEIQQSGHLRPSRKRLWRLRIGIRELLKRGRASGQQIERIIGHITFVSLRRRECLSILGECYNFIKKHYTEVVPLWKSVRKELQIWEGVSPMIQVDLCREWSNKVYAVDASEWGLGAVAAHMDTHSVQLLGLFTERWRSKDTDARDPRSYVLAEDERMCGLLGVSGEVFDDKKFSTVPFSAVDRTWTVVGRHRWRRPGTTPVYEALSSLYALKHALRTTKNFNKKHLILTDSMTAAVAFDKGRANAFKLRRVLEQSGALMLATNTTMKSRWIPSEWNPADAISRGSWQPSIPDRRLGHDPPATWCSDLMAEDNNKGKEEEPVFGESKGCDASPCYVKPCGDNPCGDNPCGDNPCGDNPCGVNPCGDNPCGDNPCGTAGTFDMGHRARSGPVEVQESSKSCEETSGEKPESTEELETSFGRPKDLDQVHQGLGRTSVLEQRCGTRSDGGFTVGLVGSRVSRGEVPRRRRFECGKLHYSSSDVSCSKVQSHAGTSKIPAGPQRLASPLPSSEQDACSIRGGLFDRSTCSSDEEVGDWPCLVVHLSALLETRGGISSESARHSQTCQESWEGISTLQCDFESNRGGGAIKDNAVGRDACPGFAIPKIHGARTFQDSGLSKPKTRRISLQSLLGRSEYISSRKLDDLETDKAGGASSLQVEARGCLSQSIRASSPTSCNPSSRLLGDFEKRQELRKGQQVASAFQHVRKERARQSNSSKKGHRQTFPCEALIPKLVLNFVFFLEIFSGSGRLGRSVHKKCGWPVLLWDLNFGEQYDLTNRTNQQRIIHWMSSGLVRAGHLGTPCNTFSRARDQPGPPPLRSDACPLGLQGLRPGDAAKVRLGNILMRFTSRVLLLALQLHVPFTLENPQSFKVVVMPSYEIPSEAKECHCQLG